MSAPTPLNGPNPFTGAYQTRQFDIGHPELVLFAEHKVSDALANPSPTWLAGENVNPIEEEADFAAKPQPGIIGYPDSAEPNAYE